MSRIIYDFVDTDDGLLSNHSKSVSATEGIKARHILIIQSVYRDPNFCTCPKMNTHYRSTNAPTLMIPLWHNLLLKIARKENKTKIGKVIYI